MRLFIIEPAELTLFNGAAAGTGGEGATGTGETAAPSQAGSQAQPGSGRRARRAGGLDNVVYGKAPEAAQTETAEDGQEGSDAGSEEKTEPTKEEKRRAFRDLIENEYKDEYTEEFQTAFDRRFKDAKTNEETLTQLRPLLDTLSRKYGITDGDMAKLAAAVEKDDSNFTAGAEEMGLNVEQYKNVLELQRKAEAYDQMTRQNEAMRRANAQIAAWEREGEALKEQYPDFDFSAEVKNPAFMSMLRSNVPVKQAYEVIHMTEIMQRANQQTAQQTEKRVTEGIRARGARPPENGVSSQSGVVYRSDPSKFTKEDRAEIARRAARGEKITF